MDTRTSNVCGYLNNEFAQMTFHIFLSLVTFTCRIKMTSIFFQAVGEPVKESIIYLARDLICFVPLGIVLPKIMGITGKFWVAPIADTIGIIVSMTLISLFLKSLYKDDDKVSNDLNINSEWERAII